VASTEVHLASGGPYRVEGTPREVEARIVSAARGSIMEFVWLTDATTGEPLAVNPERVVALRAAAG
jgi:hypothetical protein